MDEVLYEGTNGKKRKRELDQTESGERELEKRESEKRTHEERESGKRESEKMESEKKESEKREQEKRESEKREQEKRESEKKGSAEQESEKREHDRRESEKREQEKRESEKKDQEKRESERKESGKQASLLKESSKIRDFPCQVCWKRFKHLGHLQQHSSAKHSILLATPRQMEPNVRVGEQDIRLGQEKDDIHGKESNSLTSSATADVTADVLEDDIRRFVIWRCMMCEEYFPSVPYSLGHKTSTKHFGLECLICGAKFVHEDTAKEHQAAEGRKILSRLNRLCYPHDSSKSRLSIESKKG
jgi:hypothetical protein